MNVRLTATTLVTLLTACQVQAGLPVIPARVATAATDGVPLASTPTPAPSAWQPLAEDVQTMAEALAPRICYNKVDAPNAPFQLLYTPYTNGRLIALRYFVLYKDEDLHSKIEDAVYDLFRKQHYGSVTDIEPIEVFADAQTQAFAGVAFKTAHDQDYYKVFVEENTWLTFRPEELLPSDHVGDHPRLGVSTWNHLHDLPSTLLRRTYAPDTDAPPLPVQRLTDAASKQWRFDVRGLTGGPQGNAKKLMTTGGGL